MGQGDWGLGLDNHLIFKKVRRHYKETACFCSLNEVFISIRFIIQTLIRSSVEVPLGVSMLLIESVTDVRQSG